MPSSDASQKIQLVKETSYGVTPATPTYQRLNDVGIRPAPQFVKDPFAPRGQLLPVLATLNDEFVQGAADGRLSYTGIGFVLSSLFGPPVTTTPAGGTTSKQHVWTWDGSTEPVPGSYTAQYGDAAFADLITGLFFNSLSFGGGRADGLSFAATILAKALTEGQTLATGATNVPTKPMNAPDMDVFVDNTWAALGTTRMLQAYQAEVAIAERYARTMPINSSKSSDGLVQVADQQHTLGINFAVDAASKALFAAIRADTKKFARTQWTGPTIETAIKHLFQVDCCWLLTDTPGFADYNNLHAIRWNGRMAFDEVSGNGMKFTLVNTIAGY